ncbi:MAG TPA: Gfo/Idh/MocA family oxidoreductase [Polyangiaceae bacterium]|nr:Gfo/Idh/MocA family oxidoreductase [Polyangiaceae bacterium]
MASERKIRYALVGAGNIAQVAVLPAFSHAKDNSELIAIVSGDAEKRSELAKRYELGLTGSYEELEAVLSRGQIDAVYIATPNELHKPFALRAAAVGVHVLCEKPLAASVADAEEMATACANAKVKLMTAYRLHFEKGTLSAIELVKSGKIGDPRIFESVFGHTVRPGDIRTRADLGGGAMFDLGVYCVNAVRNLFQEEPLLAFATSQMKDGVDDSTTALLHFPHGRIAHFTVSNSIAGVSSYRVVGTDGDLRVEPAYEYTDKIEQHLTVDGKTSSTKFGKRDQFAPELSYFSGCILEDRDPEPDAEEAIDDLRVIEAILRSAQTRAPVALEPRQRIRRPTMAQEAKERAIGKQETVHAPSPSVK